MRVLNLYAGIGGNRKHWKGVEVTAVEKNEKIASVYKEFFPNDTVIIGDAHQYLLEHHNEFDFIWSSPPCQSHSKMVKFTRHNSARYADMSLYQEIIFLENFFAGKYVVENVVPYYKPLIPAQKIGRHLFWSNFIIPVIEIPGPDNFINLNNTEASKKLMDWLGIHYNGNVYYEGNHSPVQVLRNAVHPDIGLHVFNASKINTQLELN